MRVAVCWTPECFRWKAAVTSGLFDPGRLARGADEAPVLALVHGRAQPLRRRSLAALAQRAGHGLARVLGEDRHQGVEERALQRRRGATRDPLHLRDHPAQQGGLVHLEQPPAGQPRVDRVVVGEELEEPGVDGGHGLTGPPHPVVAQHLRHDRQGPRRQDREPVERVVLVEAVADREPDRVLGQEAAPVELAPRHGDEPQHLLAGRHVQGVAPLGEPGPAVRVRRVATFAGAVDDLLVVAHREVRVAGLSRLHEALEHPRLDEVVTVDEAHPAPRRPLEPRVRRGGDPAGAVRGQQHRHEARVAGAERRDQLRRRVARAVVDDQHLDVGQGLRGHARQALLDVGRDVVRGHDDAHARHVLSLSAHESVRRMIRFASRGSRRTRIRVKSPRSIRSRWRCRRTLSSAATSGVSRVVAQAPTRSTKSQ